MNSREASEKLQREFKDCQKILTAIGDETRQHLISIMIMDKCAGSRVVDIAKYTNLSRPAVSHHMQILKDAGIVSVRKEGTYIYYYLNMDDNGLHKLSVLLSDINELIKTGKGCEFD